MRRILKVLFCIISVLIVLGCAHKYSTEEYSALESQHNACENDLKKNQDENQKLLQQLQESKVVNNQKSQEIEQCLNDKQAMLDKIIECLEDNKILLQQISRFNDIMKKKNETQVRLNQVYEYILSYLDTERAGDQLSIIKSSERIKIVIPQWVLFPNARSAWLTPSGSYIIKKIAQGLKQMQFDYIEIAGHTDNTALPQETKKVYPSNWHLAQARSLAVLQIFEVQDVPKDKMCAITYAETQPIADNSTPEGRAINRRVEIIIHP